jgi:hypothetical protein
MTKEAKAINHRAFRFSDQEMEQIAALRSKLGFTSNIDVIRYMLAAHANTPTKPNIPLRAVLPPDATMDDVLDRLGKGRFDICPQHNNSAYGSCWKNHLNG